MIDIKNISGDKKVEIEPNPFSYYTIISIPESIKESFSLDVFDINGKKVFNQQNIISNKFILGRNSLLPGNYFYKIYTRDYHYLLTGKIIVN